MAMQSRAGRQQNNSGLRFPGARNPHNYHTLLPVPDNPHGRYPQLSQNHRSFHAHQPEVQRPNPQELPSQKFLYNHTSSPYCISTMDSLMAPLNSFGVSPPMTPARSYDISLPNPATNLTAIAASFVPENMLDEELVTLRSYEASVNEFSDHLDSHREKNYRIEAQHAMAISEDRSMLTPPLILSSVFPLVSAVKSSSPPTAYATRPPDSGIRHSNPDYKSVEMQNIPKSTILATFLMGEKAAAQRFVHGYQTNLDSHEVSMWMNAREIIGEMFSWLGYRARPRLIKEGKVISCPYISKSDFLCFLNDKQLEETITDYVRQPIPLLKQRSKQPLTSPLVAPGTSITYLLRLLDMPLQPNPLNSLVHDLTVRDTIETLIFVENISLQALCTRGVWGKNLSEVDKLRRAFAVTVRGWLGIFPAQDIPRNMFDGNTYEGGMLLKSRIQWLRQRKVAKNNRWYQKVENWEAAIIKQKLSEYLIWGKQNGLLIDAKQLADQLQDIRKSFEAQLEQLEGRLTKTTENFNLFLQYLESTGNGGLIQGFAEFCKNT